MNFPPKTVAGFLAVTGSAMASTAVADAGGDPEHRESIFKRPAAERSVEVVRAAAPTAAPRRWHDKTDEEWRAYHRERDRRRAVNAGR